MAARIIDPDLGQPVLFVLTSTMGLAPILIQHSGVIARLVSKTSIAAHLQKEDAGAHSSKNLNDHVILCGCGRVGRLVAVVLEAAKISYVGIESAETRRTDTMSFSATPAGAVFSTGWDWSARSCSSSPSTSDGRSSGCCTMRDIVIPESPRSSARPTIETCRDSLKPAQRLFFRRT
jgi:hypothetical protein